MPSDAAAPKVFREDCARYPGALQADWFEPRRRQAHERFLSQGFPTRAHEGWKYLPLDEALGRPYATACAFDAVTIARGYFLKDAAARLALVNGRCSAELSSPGKLPAGVRFGSLASALRDDSALVRSALGSEAERDALAAINTYRFSDGALLHVPAGVRLERPLHLLMVQDGDQAVFPRLLVVLEAGASATLVVEQIDGMGALLSDIVTEVRLGEGASLEWIEAGYFGPHASRFASARVDLGAGARYRETSLGFGGALSRGETLLRFLGDDASAEVRTLSMLGGGEKAYRHVLAEHKAARGVSRQTLKSVLARRSRAEANSQVHVASTGVGSDSRQQLRALLLSDDAQAWVRPQLRIDTDDVACSHGAATGRIERSELFYLRSRGIDEETARALLVYAFAEEVLDGIEEGELRSRLDGAVHAALDEAEAKGGRDAGRRAF